MTFLDVIGMLATPVAVILTFVLIGRVRELLRQHRATAWRSAPLGEPTQLEAGAWSVRVGFADYVFANSRDDVLRAASARMRSAA